MNRSIKPVVLFTAVYLCLGQFAALKSANWEFVFYIPIVFAFGLIALVLRERAKFSIGLLWCLSIWGLLHVMGGLVSIPDGWKSASDIRVLYSWEIIPGILVYDKPVHAFGFAVATWACWQGLQSAGRIEKPTFGSMTLAVLAGNGLGAFNEVVEFIAAQTMETNVGGYINTGGDLIANLVGSLVAATLLTISYAGDSAKTANVPSQESSEAASSQSPRIP